MPSGVWLVTRCPPRTAASASSSFSRVRPAARNASATAPSLRSASARSRCSTLTYSSFICCASASAAFRTSFTRGAMYTWPAGAPGPETRGSRSSACWRRCTSAAGLPPAFSTMRAATPPSCPSSATARCSTSIWGWPRRCARPCAWRIASWAFSVNRLGSMLVSPCRRGAARRSGRPGRGRASSASRRSSRSRRSTMIAAPAKFTPRSRAGAPSAGAGPRRRRELARARARVGSTSPRRTRRASRAALMPAAAASSSPERCTSARRGALAIDICSGVRGGAHARSARAGRSAGAEARASAPRTPRAPPRSAARGPRSDDRVEIAAAAVRARQPAAAQAQTPPALRAGRHLERHRPVGRLDPHLAPEDRLPRPERQIHLQIVAGHAGSADAGRGAGAGRGRPAARRRSPARPGRPGAARCPRAPRRESPRRGSGRRRA